MDLAQDLHLKISHLREANRDLHALSQSSTRCAIMHEEQSHQSHLKEYKGMINTIYKPINNT